MEKKKNDLLKITVEENDKTRIVDSKKMPYLVVYMGMDSGKCFRVKEGKMSVGRDSSADILIDDERISRVHCIIDCQKDKIIIEDQNSRNGTYINGEQITSQIIYPNSTIQIGRTVMKLEYKNQAQIQFEDTLYYLDNIINSMIDFFIVIDQDGIIKTMNKAILGTLGYEKEDLLGKSLTSIFEDGFEKVFNIKNLKDNLFIKDIESILLSKEGKKIPVLFSILLIKDKRDCLQALVCVAKDITERKETEKQLHTFKEKLKKSAEEIKEFTGQINDLKGRVRRNEVFRDIIGNSEKLNKVFQELENVLEKDVNVLLLGESGTGKELLARAIHNGSKRKDGPFIVVNCSAITHELAESTLFGHSKGAFTGAVNDHAGYFEQANNGTIFLDEIGDMDINIQAKVLRVIEEKKVTRIGEERERETGFRILSATNRDLTEAVSQGKFRDDLYFRLEEYPIHIPPLRARVEDIPLLAEYFLKVFCDFNETAYLHISKTAMEKLISYHWAGNIRELKNVLQRAAVRCKGGIIEDVEFSNISKGNPFIDREGKRIISGLDMPKQENKEQTLEELEQITIKKAYLACDRNVEKTARALGISSAALYRRLKKFNIED
ncbi:MAG: sigma 54-interacting transcriptional regulator [bacterium]